MYKILSYRKSKPLNEETIIEKSLSGVGFTREELTFLLLEADPEWVYDIANKIRKQLKGNIVYLRAIIEFSNYCKNNCLYCGIRRDNKKLKRYRMNEDEILEVAEKLVNNGFRTIVLQSGEDPFWSAKKLSNVVRKLKKLDVAVTLSIGELSYEDYKLLRVAGADRFLLKHETIDEKLFSWLKPDTTLKERIQRLYWLKELGYEVGVGCIVGLPGQRIETLVDDLLFLQELKPNMVGHGPFIPHPQTPLASFPSGFPYLTLKLITLTRIILPKANIPATTALNVLAPDLRFKAFLVGANVLMPDLTPTKYKLHYEIYPGKGTYQTKLEDYFEFFEKINLRTDLRLN
ncbi:[FeFe] hydrogenase H-cluster radical SAM maturase HydE [Thermodesulfobacterium sp. TA1]|uniref:[FeFe] hydrogenase H-cluster radical SAM maturase HydE n=1 Tax=Thermodesulfobacterium sp. TA1 TaxID=2234087 RepID=UPI0012324044|nr:[FeFe] hydrogenase H-cluster radical SAM maturase HydE [Thermodesulfobacterium sp. TA1]QER42601.1 [FeFe] hydrogenase H-cluster radical SAM maturase HydE [Thermodesulfobacterium sp. TA1]